MFNEDDISQTVPLNISVAARFPPVPPKDNA